MKTFHYPLGHVAGSTMTVAELRAALAKYPDNMPVFAEWEGCRAYIEESMFSQNFVDKGVASEAANCLIIDVNIY